MSFDIVIPVGPNDYSIISDTIDYTKKNIVGYRNIYIISPKEMHFENCIYISEDIFPFISTIKDKIKLKSRVGWYIQQIIKLYCGFYIPDILDNYLILDSDVYFLKRTEFMTNDMIPLYGYGTEYHLPYFDHMSKLHPSLKRIKSVSGICHHMMFTKKYLIELFQLIEIFHNNLFLNVFLENVSENNSGASEYEIYFNFMLLYHPDKIEIRDLKWGNISTRQELLGDYDFVAFHYYSR